MTSAWFLGAQTSVPQSEMDVRSTVAPLRDDPESAQLQAAPDWNQIETDSSGTLTGLNAREVAGHTSETEKYPAWWIEGASAPHNIVVDAQVASSGTAAAREAAGQQGHGTMQYTESLDPEIHDGMTFGSDYFTTHEKGIQNGAGSYMEPVADAWANRVAASRAAANSRGAYQASEWDALFT